MNNQTSGPLSIHGISHDIVCKPFNDPNTSLIAATRYLGSTRLLEHKANASLLAAAYTSYDKAGRALGIDAAELAQNLDIEALVRTTRDLKTAVFGSDASAKHEAGLALRAVLAAIPQAKS